MRNREFRFLLVGGFNTVFNWAVFVGLQTIFGRDAYLIDLFLMYGIGSVVGFTLYRTFVFRVRGRVWTDFGRYQLVSIWPFVANLVVLPLFVHFFALSPVVAQTIFVIFNTAWSYLGHRYFSFRRSAEPAATNLPVDLAADSLSEAR